MRFQAIYELKTTPDLDEAERESITDSVREEVADAEFDIESQPLDGDGAIHEIKLVSFEQIPD